MERFSIPIVLFVFKRLKAIEIINRISIVKPKKLYLIADYGRTLEEKAECDKCRMLIEKAINWDCEVIKNYSDNNRGVYANIALGAKWVFKREEKAIFLEDDNLPEITFFQFCEEMLDKYLNEEKILWICGTNYLGKSKFTNDTSYTFTQHMLPCGWASWSCKFLKYYDGDFKTFNKNNLKRLKKKFTSRALANQFESNWLAEYDRIKSVGKFYSWDYQIDYSLKYYDLYGICPSFNQIKNIGADECSIHGGNDINSIMTKRFCEIDTFPISFPLIHPKEISIDSKFEKQIGKILLLPLKLRIKIKIAEVIRKLFKIPQDQSIKKYFKGKLLK